MNTKNHFSRIKTNLEVLRRIGVKVPDGDIVPGKKIKLIPFDIHKDYLTDEIVIKELRKWCGLDD